MRKLTKKKIIYIFTIIFLLYELLANRFNLPKTFLLPTKTPTPTTSFTNKKIKVTVKRIVDGDTIELTTGEKVRYIGINTPELHDPNKSIECLGQEASDENKRLVEGKEILIEKDVSNVDKYGRLLRFVYVESSTSSGEMIFVNDYLVRQGFAQVSTFPPDVKYQTQFIEAQSEAQINNRGLWKSCITPLPTAHLQI